jgi:membrane protein implicated in regulation of membrane protease activity
MFVLLAIALLLVLPSPWNVIGFAAALVCFCGELAFWHRRVRHRPAAVGVDTMVGEVGTVVSPCRPHGQVQVLGTIWAARCAMGADQGDSVTVVGRRRLTLIVEPRRGSVTSPASDDAVPPV